MNHGENVKKPRHILFLNFKLGPEFNLPRSIPPRAEVLGLRRQGLQRAGPAGLPRGAAPGGRAARGAGRRQRLRQGLLSNGWSIFANFAEFEKNTLILRYQKMK